LKSVPIKLTIRKLKCLLEHCIWGVYNFSNSLPEKWKIDKVKKNYYSKIRVEWKYFKICKSKWLNVGVEGKFFITPSSYEQLPVTN
jgi:hypothetical protein